MKRKALRQLAKELGISHSYLSQIEHGKRSASHKVVSKMVSSGKHDEIDISRAHGYNLRVLGNRLVVGQRTLNP